MGIVHRVVVGVGMGIGNILIAGMLLAQPQEAWVKSGGPVRDTDLRGAVYAERGLFFCATKDAVYKTKDALGKWDLALSLTGGENEINCLAWSPDAILVGTRRGLLKTVDGGERWKSAFTSLIPEKSNVLCVATRSISPGIVYIGTERGVYRSDDNGQRWRDISGPLKNVAVRRIASYGEKIYALTDAGLYVSGLALAQWQRLYVKTSGAGSDGLSAPDEAPQDAEYVAPGALACKDGRILIGCGKKMLSSDDGGKMWRRFPPEGMRGYINEIYFAKDAALYCATTKGTFFFDDATSRWKELYKGQDKDVDVRGLLIGDGEEPMLAVTDKGLYRLERSRFIDSVPVDVEKAPGVRGVIWSNEPEYRQLQQAAIRYANVRADKIKRWESEARLKALLPKVSCGFDKDRSTNTEIYTSATKEYSVIGPDDVNQGFSASVSWELGDLIWDDDQANIDVRSRLLVQLRNDILDDLRRVYFERRRLQYEALEGAPTDGKVRFEKEMRIAELTQAIDDLTDNYFSDYCHNQQKK